MGAQGQDEAPRDPPLDSPGQSGTGDRLDVRVRATPGVVSGVRDALGRLEVPARLLGDACLLTSELVTNSIRHAGLRATDCIHVSARWSGRRLRVDVHDGGRLRGPPGESGAIRPHPSEESGWGLYLVERLASRWGRSRGRYWFELELDQD